MNPNRGPLAIFTIVEYNNKLYLNYIIHHIIFDGKSTEIFNRVFNNLLANKDYTLNKDYSYIKVARYDQSINSSELYNQNIKNFDTIFKDVNEIPTICPQDHGTASTVVKKFNINYDLLQKLIKDTKITEATFFDAVFGLVYSNFVYSDTPVFCITDNGRDLVTNNDSIGMYVKNIPIALSIKDVSVKSYLKDTFNIAITARKSATLPFSEYKNRYNVDASVVFQYFSNYLALSNVMNKQDTNDSILRSFADIDCYLYKQDNTFILSIAHSAKYDDHLVKAIADTIERVTNELLIKENIADIEYAGKQDLDFCDKQNKTETKLRFYDIVDAFKYHCDKSPNKLCCVYKDKKYTYKQIDELSNGLAQYLIKAGVKKQDHIAIHVDISELYLISALAILKLDAIYIPINTEYPASYINTLLDVSKAKFLLTTSKTQLKINEIKQLNIDNIDSCAKFIPYKYNKHDTACIIFTSGTTGTPKGAEITRLGMANLCD